MNHEDAHFFNPTVSVNWRTDADSGDFILLSRDDSVFEI